MFAGWSCELFWQLDPSASTYRLTHPSAGVRFVKLKSGGGYPGLSAEAARMAWLRDHLPAPEVLSEGSEGGVDWLVTIGLPGHDATDDCWSGDHERLVRALARGLRQIHSVPVAGCPFDFRLEAALLHVRGRAQSGSLVPERDFHPEYAHLGVAEAVAQLSAMVPTSEDLVVCHGDYCPPNVLLDDWKPVGFVDLGELGVADRWWDLAVATWSVDWSFGPGFEEVFLSE
jgi:aminoglycoside phosphotransferase